MWLYRRTRRIFLGVAGVVALVLPLAAAAPSAVARADATATTDTSPVDLSTNVGIADGKAAQQATVVEGDARFEVLTPEVVRLEYSPTGSFLDEPTFNILDRNFAVPSYATTVQNGWLVLTTSGMVLRYRLGSGPFTPANTQMQLLDPLSGASANVSPTWEWECTFGQVCQSGAASLSGGAIIASDHQNHVSPAGFIAGLTTGASASWQVLGASSGDAEVTIRYSNYIGSLGGPAPRTISLVVNGTATQVTLPKTLSWDDWATVTEPVSLASGTNTMALTCGSSDDCNVNVDDIAVTASGATAAPFLPWPTRSAETSVSTTPPTAPTPPRRRAAAGNREPLARRVSRR